MKVRSAGLLIAVFAAQTACKKSHEEPTPPAPVTPVGKDASVAVTPAADPWAKGDAAHDPLKRPMFWSVEKDGKTSYVLGTMHMGVDPQTRLPKLVWQRFDEAKTFAMETDLGGSGGLDIALKGDKTLRDLLGDEYWKKLEAALGKDEAQRYLRLKPMIPATVLQMRSLPQTPPMDGVLLGRAINQKKNIVYLEKIEHQAAMLEKWMTPRALRDMLDDLAEGEKHAKEMFAAYVAGDDEKLLALTAQEREDFKKHGRSEKEYDAQMEDLLYKRNASWIAPIEKLHAEGGGFIAVGAMHVVGKRSVLDLLQQKGYKVTRITP
jgi:uncharacterized protein